MARTVQAVFDRVRELLQDKQGERYLDEELAAHVVDAVVCARAVRPDLFVASYETPLPDTLDPTDTLPLPDQFFAAVCYDVVGAAEERDDEFAVDGRAANLKKALVEKLVTGM